MKKILVGDIGGTNTRLGVFTTNTKKISKIKRFETNKDVEDEIKKMLSQEKLQGISLGLAGPLKNNEVKFTNKDLTISSKNLKKKTGLDAFLLNDFEALGYYAKKQETKKRLVLGAGTGLGKVFVTKEVMSSEGGCMDFPFRKGEEKIRDFFQKKLKKTPDYDSIVSGKGISTIKQFLSKKAQKKEELEPKNIFLNKEKNINKKTILLFSKFYGRFVKNCYIDFLPEEILLAGGIVRKNPWIIKTKEFQDEIKHELIKKENIKIIRDEYAGLKGVGIAFIHKNI